MITYLKNTGSTYCKLNSYFPEFEKVVETGLNRYGKPEEGGEYTRFEGWDGMIESVSSLWCSSMEYTAYTAHAFNPYTGETFSLTGWTSDFGEPVPTYTKGLKPEYQKILDDARLANWKKQVREDFDSYANEIRQFAPLIVTRGRKVAKGTTGYLFWQREGQYGVSFGLKNPADPEKAIFVAARNCDRDPEFVVEWDEDCQAALDACTIEDVSSRHYRHGYHWFAQKLVDEREKALLDMNAANHKASSKAWAAKKNAQNV